VNTPERWRQIEGLYHAASERAPEDRAHFLQTACNGDHELRAEVESLLRIEGQEGDFLEGSPVGVVVQNSLALKPGGTLGNFQIIASIGRGGMGQVWKARDLRLGRNVAIKTSDKRFSYRFEREARSIAALNHPNICTLHDVGPNYLVMELVEGPTLAERIAQGPIPLEEALGLAGQIADALEVAHEKGIVHRDLKPGNIKITCDGSVKILDFGLAKSEVQQAVTPDSPTLLSSAGMILGTASYMSPEQARGQPVDKRTDIWAFGVVLYELLTGEKLFEAETVSDTIAAVLTKQTDLTKVPKRVRHLLDRCLAKDPKRRLRDIAEWSELLDSEQALLPAAAPKTPWIVAGIFAGMFGLALASLALLYFREKPAQMPVTRLALEPPENASFSPYLGVSVVPAVSPDRQRIAFAAHTRDGRTQLWVRSLDSVSAQPLAGIDAASLPFWSPDSKSIGFFSKGKLNRIDANGGPVLALADAGNPRGASWSSQGLIVFAPAITGVLRKVSAAGGAVSDAGKLSSGEPSQRWPWFLPDGKHFLFAAGLSGVSRKAIRLGLLDSTESTKLLEADSDAIYSAGYLLFLRGDTLMAQPFDPRNLRLSGEALPVVEHVQNGQNTSFGAFSASANGLLAYAGGSAEFELGWFDRKGNRIGSLGEAAQFNRLNFSPDRNSLAVSITTGSNTDIWLYDVASGLRTRFTFDPANETDAVWSPDGRTIAFSSSRKGHLDLYRKSANGSGAEEPLYIDNLEKYPQGISPDGKFLLYYTIGDAKTGNDLWILPGPLGPPGTAKSYSFLQSQSNELNGEFSPDGHWVAYTSDETGRFEVYVMPFPGPGGKRQISTEGGQTPRWRRDGKELFYIALDQKLMAAEITTKDGEIQHGEVRPLFGPLPVGNGYQYDVSADGQRILAITPRQNVSEPLTIVQNWPAGLKK
jgi:Tol biopolymer transport system component